MPPGEVDPNAPGPGDFPGPGEGRLDDGFFGDDPFFGEELLPTGAGATTGAEGEVSIREIATRAFIGGLMLLFVVVLFLWLRGMRGLTPSNQFYLKLSRGAGWGGVRRHPSMTPHEYARTVGDQVPNSRVPATYLTDLYVQETYGQRPPIQAEIMRARQAWLRLRGVLLKHFVLRLKPWGRRHDPNGDENDW